MATKVWIGTDGDWATVGNWSPSGIPVDGDKVIVPDGAAALTTNIDRTGDTAGAGLDLALFYSSPLCTTDIGSSGSPLRIAADKVIHQGTGTLYLQADDGTGSLVIDSFVCSSNNLIDACVLTEGATGVFDQVEIEKGGCSASLVGANSLFVFYRANPTTDTRVTLTSVFTGTIWMTGGTLASTAQLGVVHLNGGTWTHSGGDVTNVYVNGGLWVYDLLKVDASANLVVLTGGVIDTTRTAGEKEFTLFKWMPSGQLITNSDLHFGGTTPQILGATG